MARLDSQDETSSELLEELLQAAQPELYRHNAFRLSELWVDAGPRELARREQMVAMATQSSLPIPPGPGRIAGLPTDASPDQLRRAIQRLADPLQRILDEFFWFWPLEESPAASDGLLNLLATQGLPAAVGRWRDLEPTSPIASHNLAVAEHLQALEWEATAEKRELTEAETIELQRHWRAAFSHWSHLPESCWERLQSRMKKLNDPRLTPDLADRIRNTLPTALFVINAQLVVEATPATQPRRKQIFQDAPLNDEARLVAAERQLKPLQQRLELLGNAAKEQADSLPLEALASTPRYLQEAQKVLSVFDALLDDPLLEGKDNVRQTAYDDVLGKAISCLWCYANKSEDWAGAAAFCQTLSSLARGPASKAKIQESQQRLDNNASSANDWCTAGYWQLEASLLQKLEEAHRLARGRLWDKALEILLALLRDAGEPDRPVIRRCLAFCLSHQGIEQLKAAVAQIQEEEQNPPQIIQKIRRNVAHMHLTVHINREFGPTLITLGGSQPIEKSRLLCCLSCCQTIPAMLGVVFRWGEQRYFTCRACEIQLDAERDARKNNIREKISTAWQHLLLAHRVDPADSGVHGMLATASDLAGKADVPKPSYEELAKKLQLAEANLPEAPRSPSLLHPKANVATADTSLAHRHALGTIRLVLVPLVILGLLGFLRPCQSFFVWLLSIFMLLSAAGLLYLTRRPWFKELE